MDVITTNVVTQELSETVWPPLSRNAEAEQRLLDFVADLILDVARTHPRVRDLDVALWIARVAIGVKNQ